MSVVAEDKQGRPVVDLKAEELVLSDGGRPERIVSFTAQPLPSAAATALPPGTFTNRLDRLTGGSVSVTAILFDGLNTPMARQSYARQQVLAFLRQVEPGNTMALYTLGRGLSVLQDLTRDPQPLVRALEQYRGELSAETGAARLDTAGTGLEPFGSWLDELETNLIEHYAKDRALRTLRSLVAIANHLEKVPGRKNLVWVSGSFPVWIGRDRVRLPERPRPGEQDLWPEIDRAARALNRANLAVYPVDARGLMSPSRLPAGAGLHQPGDAARRPLRLCGHEHPRGTNGRGGVLQRQRPRASLPTGRGGFPRGLPARLPAIARRLEWEVPRDQDRGHAPRGAAALPPRLLRPARRARRRLVPERRAGSRDVEPGGRHPGRPDGASLPRRPRDAGPGHPDRRPGRVPAAGRGTAGRAGWTCGSFSSVRATSSSTPFPTSPA